MSVTIKRKRGRPRRDEPREINEFDLALIREFKARPALYDRTHPQYRNREYLEPLWVDIAQTLGYDVSLVRDRMIQLRNRYNIEKRRVESLQDQYNDPTISSQWALFSELTFLSDHIKSRRSFQNPIAQQRNEYNNSSDSEESQQNSNASAAESDQVTDANVQNNASNEANDNKSPQTKPQALYHVPNGTQKFHAFAQFLASSLIEMNESDALNLIEKFTVDLVQSLRAAN